VSSRSTIVAELLYSLNAFGFPCFAAIRRCDFKKTDEHWYSATAENRIAIARWFLLVHDRIGPNTRKTVPLRNSLAALASKQNINPAYLASRRPKTTFAL